MADDSLYGMVKITLYPPDSATPQEYEALSYAVRDGALQFRVDGPLTDITTTVPFLVRQTPQTAAEKKPRRITGGLGARPSTWG
jgi:hypothetical protein